MYTVVCTILNNHKSLRVYGNILSTFDGKEYSRFAHIEPAGETDGLIYFESKEIAESVATELGKPFSAMEILVSDEFMRTTELSVYKTKPTITFDE